MTGFSRPTSAEASFMKLIREEIDRRLPTGLVLPVHRFDPPVTDPTNLWMRTDGRLRGRYWDGAVWVYLDYPLRTDITAPPAVPAAPAAPAKPVTPVTNKKTYTATWTQSYQGDGDKRTDTRGENYLVYGNSGDTANGTQRSLIGFNYATIVSDLATSTIKRVELKMTNVHAYWPSGVRVYFGMHNVTSEPTLWPASSSLPLRRVVDHSFGRPETKTVALTVEFGQRLRAGTAKGIAIEAPSSSKDYYGYAAGVGSGYTPPQLIITYTK